MQQFNYSKIAALGENGLSVDNQGYCRNFVNLVKLTTTLVGQQ